MWVNKTSQQCFIQQRRCEVYQCAERRECLCSLHYFTAGAALSFHRLWPSGLFFAAPLCRSRFLLSCTSNGNQLSPPVNQLRRGRVHKQNHTISRWRRQWDGSCCQCHRVWSHLEHSGNMDLFFIPLSASFSFTLEQKSHDSVAACIWLIIQIRLKKWLNRRFSLDSELSFVDVSHLVCSKRTGCFRGEQLDISVCGATTRSHQPRGEKNKTSIFVDVGCFQGRRADEWCHRPSPVADSHRLLIPDHHVVI